MKRAVVMQGEYVRVRPAQAHDIEAIAAIYRHHVLHGTATFELEPPDAAEVQRRCEAVRANGLPWVVAVEDDVVVGYGYADVYRVRPAYRYTVEDSVYLHPDWCGRGIGRRLLDSVIEESIRAGFRQMVAVIGDSANAASIAVHRSAGFRMVGTLENVGLKFGRWLDTVIMQRSLGGGACSLPGEMGGGFAR